MFKQNNWFKYNNITQEIIIILSSTHVKKFIKNTQGINYKLIPNLNFITFTLPNLTIVTHYRRLHNTIT